MAPRKLLLGHIALALTGLSGVNGLLVAGRATGIRQFARCLPLLSKAADLELSFPLSVYIEDTDACKLTTHGMTPRSHGLPIILGCPLADAVVYYGNYLRMFERAAMATLIGPEATGELLSAGIGIGLVSADGMKYGTAAVLGDRCRVNVTPKGMDAAGTLAFAASLVRNADGRELCSASDLRLGLVSSGTSALTSAWPQQLAAPVVDTSLPVANAAFRALSEPPPASASPPLDPANLRLQIDEASVCGRLSLHAATRYFERHRTTFLGGPDALAALSSSGVNVVVARIRGLRLLPAAHAVLAGSALTLRCAVSLKARGTQVVFDQWLLNGEGSEPLAYGEHAVPLARRPWQP